MFGLGKTKNLVGLDIGSSAVKAVELRKKGNTYELVNMGIEPLGQDTVVDGAIMDALSVSSAIEKIFNDNRIKTKNVATSVSGHSVIVKRVTVPAETEEEVYNAIPYEAQQHIPFDMTDVNLSYQALGLDHGAGNRRHPGSGQARKNSESHQRPEPGGKDSDGRRLRRLFGFQRV